MSQGPCWFLVGAQSTDTHLILWSVQSKEGDRRAQYENLGACSGGGGGQGEAEEQD